MNIGKAKSYLNKINRLFTGIEEDGGDVSQIEKDLMLSYVREFYDSVIFEAEPATAKHISPKPPVFKTKTVVPKEVITKTQPKVEPVKEEKSNVVEFKIPKQAIEQPKPKVETPVYVQPKPREIPKVETPVYVQPKPKVETPKVETPVYVQPKPKVETPKVETPVYVQPKPKVETPKVETPVYVQPKPKVETPKVETPVYVQPKPKVETPNYFQQEIEPEITPLNFDEYDILFEEERITALSQRLGQGKITNLRTSMGINERFLIQNELFGGNSNLFNKTLDTLNEFENFVEAKAYIIKEAAPENDWLDDNRIKRAQAFIRKIRRRYKD
jgi:hypothetical protein